MTLTSSIPLTVDGTRLDTYAYNIESLSGRLMVPGVRGSNPVVPARSGSIYVPNKTYDDGTILLSMWAQGNDVDGLVSSTAMTHFRANVDFLMLLFSKRYGLLDVQQTWPSGVRQAFCEVLGAYDMSANAASPRAKFNVLLNIPAVFWQDTATADQSSTANPTPGSTVTLTGTSGTAPLENALMYLRGPAVNPRLTDTRSGSWVQYNGTLATNEDWQIDNGNWTSRSGATIAYTPGAGTQRNNITSYSGGGGGFISLTPNPTGAGYQIRIDGSGFGATTQLFARTRRKWLA